MDFIERFFGIAPDGGDGSLEVLYLFAFAVVIGAVIFHRRLRHCGRRQILSCVSASQDTSQD